jgi:DNA-binding MarR family transcriptional regulator
MSSYPETVDTTSIHQSVGYWVGLLSRTMEAEFSRRLAPHGLTRMSYAVLGAMVFDAKTTPSGIADFLGLDRGAVTRLLDKLEAQDLILRERGEDDRRSVSIEVTAIGKKLARQLQAHSRAVNAQFTAVLGRDETERFIELVKLMLTQAETRPESL